MQIIPTPGVVRALTVRSVVYATGSGVFQAGSAVFFTSRLGLSATEVGLGLSIAGVLSIACSVPLGVVTDRLGARRTWIITGILQACLFFCYPLVGSFAAFVLVASAIAVTEMSGSTARDVYTMEVIAPEDRVRALAYQRSALNVGFTLGAALAGVAFSVGTPTAYTTLVLANGAVTLLTTFFVLRLPPLTGSAAVTRRGGMMGALADRPFLTLSAINGTLFAHSTLFVVVLPLWTLTRTDAPKVLVPILFAVNTVLCVLLQVRASRGAETAVGAGVALRRSGLVLAACCLLLASAAWTSGWWTIGMLCLGTVVLTLGELVQSAGAWGITATLPPAARRGEYVGVFKLGRQAQQTVAPAGLTMLAVGTGGWGWLVIAALMLVAGEVAPRAVAWALRTPRIGEPEQVERRELVAA